MRSSVFRAALIAGAAWLAAFSPAFAFDEHSLNTNQVSVTSAATIVVANRPGRTSATVENLGTTALYCGNSAGLVGGAVTTSNGMLLPGIVGASITFSTSAEIDCISGGASQSVSFMEVF
jgi:hypothetical protein